MNELADLASVEIRRNPNGTVNVYLDGYGIVQDFNHNPIDVRFNPDLDPNRDEKKKKKSGIPNRQAAEYLTRTAGGGLAIRWYATRGEQFHSKLIVVRKKRTVDAILGSANLTRRNLDDYNLETSFWVHAPRGSDLDRELKLYLDRIWTNDGGVFTLPYSEFRDTSRLRRLFAWTQEVTGLGTF